MKKKFISGLLSLMMLLSVLPGSMTAYADANFQGAGTEESPYQISTANDLVKLAELTNATATAAEYADKYYKLTDDIDMTGVSYKPISYATSMYTAQGSSFKGTLDGNNHIIKNVSFANIATYGATYGIIGYLGPNGVVKNLGVENMTVNGSSSARLCIGGIAGSLSAPVTIESCYVRGMTVTTNSTDVTYVGGITGRTIGNSGLIKNCYATNLSFGNVKYASTKAGIMGSCGNTGYKAENCYTTDDKIQANTSATNSYMGATNCYMASTIQNATVANLGSAFKADSKGKNGGYPLLSWEEEANFAGEGTSEKPYLINDANDLVKLATLTNTSATAADYADKYYQLTADIDMTGVSYKPISYATNMYTAQGSSFKGTLDGNNHIIKNVSFANIATYGATYGIVGYLGPNGVVKNLGVENMTVNGGTANRLCIGGIAGSLSAPVTIESCYVRGMKVTTTSTDATYVGGITGRTIGGEGLIKNCYATNLDFSGVTYASTKAGIMGSCGNTGYKAENCYTTDAKVQGNTSATNSYMGATNCYSSSTIANATVANLGSAFKADTKGNNSGYPLLSWEIEKSAFEGEGTSEKPYLLGNAEDMVKLAELTNSTATAVEYADKYYQLIADIDMTGVNYKPISYATSMYTAQGSAFKGTLDGNNHIIKNVTMTSSIATYGATYGIIGYLGPNGVVKNLGVENITVDGGNKASRLCIGGIAGSLSAPITIENCYVRGMVATVDTTSLSDKTTYAGGITGRTIGGEGLIKNCYATNLDFGRVTFANNKAGIMGSCGNTGYKAENCYTTDVKVQGNTAATNSYMVSTNCYSSSTIQNATAENLGASFKEDVKGKNGGYPLLVWETEPESAENAELKLPDLIGDHMMIQQNKPITLWGYATPTDTVTVKLLNGTEILAEGTGVAKGTGKFTVELPKVTAGGPYQLTFTASNGTVTVNDVLVGELWVQSGQSNMERATSGTGTYKDEIIPDEANNQIRLFMSTGVVNTLPPYDDLAGSWKIADAESVNAYSAVGYSALEKLNDELDMPVGGICNAIGGASMSQYMGVENGMAGEYYNSKTAPLTQFNIRGVMWYQGEGDRNRTAEDFTATFNKLIKTWRDAWGDSDLPFVYTNLAPSPMKYYASWTGEYITIDFSTARLGQLQSYYENDNVAIAVSMDCKPNEGEDALHPNNKKPIGERLALAALDMIYDVIDNGTSPLYKSATVNGNTVEIKFNNAYAGLETTDGQAPRCFYVSENENGPFYEAAAEITGVDTVTLTSDAVSEIKYVSYAIEKHMFPYTSVDDAVSDTYADVNLVNSEGLPACPFAYNVSEVRFEKNEKPFESMKAELSSDGKKVNAEVVLNEAKVSDVNLFIAFYKENCLVGVSGKNISANVAEGGIIDYSTDVLDGATSSKVMILSGQNISPYLDAIQVSLAN